MKTLCTLIMASVFWVSCDGTQQLSQTNSDSKIALGEYLIQLEPGEEANANEILSSLGLQLVLPLGKWLHVSTYGAANGRQVAQIGSSQAQPSEQLRQELEDHPSIFQAHHNHMIRLLQIQPEFDRNEWGCTLPASDMPGDTLPNDPSLKVQWHLTDAGINAYRAWQVTKGRPQVTLAVVDEGIELNAPDLAGDVFCSNRCYEEISLFGDAEKPHNHGNRVVELLGVCTNNGISGAGVNWNSRVQGIELLPDGSLGGSLAAMMWAAGIDICKASYINCGRTNLPRNLTPAHVINTSFAHEFRSIVDLRILLDTIALINSYGSIVVSASGNDGSDKEEFPAAATGVISVGGSTKERARSKSSNWGASVDVFAPGAGVASFVGRPVAWSGTSAAAPLVSGTVALMKSMYRDLDWKSAEYILKQTAKPLTCDEYCVVQKDTSVTEQCKKICCDASGNQVCSGGIVDAYAAVTEAEKGLPHVALLDADSYSPLLVKNWPFVGTSPITVRVFNRGGARAVVEIQSAHGLVVEPRLFILEPSGTPGGKDSQNVQINWDAWRELPWRVMQQVAVDMAAHEVNKPQGYRDRFTLKLFLYRNNWF